MADPPLSDAELERYARHIVLHRIGGAGQVRLRRARVLVIGAGGLGSPALLYLAAAGVGRLEVVDDDVVALSNLQRQVLHATGDVGRAKTESAAAALGRLNPEIRIKTHALRIDPDNAPQLVEGCDAVLDGSDNHATRAAVNAACAKCRTPLITGALGSWDGMLSVFRPWRSTPCWACVSPEETGTGSAQSCAEIGVLGSLAGTIGTLMATECVKLITGTGKSAEGRLLLYDALGMDFHLLKIARREDCPVCGPLPRDDPAPGAELVTP